MTKTYLMNSLVEKMQSPDQDFRFMGLNDLMTEIKQDPSTFTGDESTETKVIKQVLSLVEDKISEVKNQAVKCLGQLIKIIRESQMDLVVDSLINFSVGKDEELRDISGLALKTITAELPPDGKVAQKACAKLAPKLLVQVSNAETPPETILETLATLSILITRFPTHLSSPNVQPQPLPTIAPILSHPRPAVRKRAILTLSQFIPYAPREQFDVLLSTNIVPFLAPNANVDRQRTTVQLISAILRTSSHHLSPVLGEVIPSLLKAVQRDDDELREGCLQTLETVVLRSPAEVTPFLSPIIQVGNQYTKYDPNYADDEDEDAEMGEADEDDEDDAELDEYSDDEDTSYKIRRSATKLLAAVVVTRPELLVTLYKEVSPVLISRFGDREETVRLEIWSTYVSLLTQTGVYGRAPQVKDADVAPRGKRKRDSEERMDVEETPYSLLKGQVQPLAKALLNQIKSSKTTPAAFQGGFNLLHSLLDVLPGSLVSQMDQVLLTSRGVLSQSPLTSTSAVHLTCLSFLALLFSTHAQSSFAGSLPTITPVLLKSLKEKHPRVSSEAFRVFSALLNACKPVKNDDWAGSVYDEALQRLSNHDTDAEVRASAEECIADLWVCAKDVVAGKGGKEWQAICRTSGNTSGSVKVVIKVARDVDMTDQWANDRVEWISGLLKKSGRSGKAEMFTALDTLLKRYQNGIPADLSPNLILLVKSFVTTADISLLGHALTIVAVLLELAPAQAYPEVESELLSSIYEIAHSPNLSGAALDALLNFLGALVSADGQIASHVIPSLVISYEKTASKAERSPHNVAKCVGQVVKSFQSVAAGAIAEYAKHVKKSSKAKSSTVVLSLLILGEIGRIFDMSPQHDIFTHVIDHFASEEEEVRAAAAFAAGNIAIGNLHMFLPAIIKIMENDAQKRLLSLHALKEVVTHCSHGQLELVAEQSWGPLFQNSEDSEESTRNVAAACLGKLTTTNPSRYLPQLHDRIKDENPAARATVVSSIRYTFAESSTSYDELLAPLIMDFLGLMLDEDLNVRRLALSALNTAARTKPYLIADHLGTLLPSLYQETVVNTDLIRTVQMGPWSHKVDDGLEARKTAYETMYTLLDTSLHKLDLHAFLSYVLAGLHDDSDEIKVICHMMLFRLAQVAPTAVSQRLDEATPQLEKTMKGAAVTKDTVKQDLERASERQRSTLRAVVALSKISNATVSPKFDAFVDELRGSPTWGNEFKELDGTR
ncbi:TIP120-domain-containing protein [Coniophora puteana RWD-64-598 SS2]|uniref:TIP120-domain-containing protein n=1 Tax=Coniophora puteana (strain RWD-64-598) TaxID=741705 RepID=A0A5M3N5V2_CONPW|nr:TIP120-domain-containing protein [Coniophora puteana RWD-64-598 SS2]EIW86241.1 TIP120-domain-containing protein [Coniophora puteana RWD-64-598 SS2]